MTQVQLQQNGKTLTARLSGEIDHHWAGILREKIDEHIQAARPAGDTAADFSAVTFMDSSGIGLILGRYKLARELGGTVVVQNVPKDIRRMLALGGHRFKRGGSMMKALNTMKVAFPSRSANEGFARSAVAAFAAQADPTMDELADIKTAVSEAVTNCIVHAYPNRHWPCHYSPLLPAGGRRAAHCGCGQGVRHRRMCPRPCSPCSPQAGPNARALALP